MAKPKATSENIYVGLDIGTTKIRAVVARKNQEDGVDILGLGSAESTGIRKGVVINIDATVNAIKDAVHEAERMSGVEIKSACVGIAGGHIKSFNSRGVIAVKNGEVMQNDVTRVIESAAAVNIPAGYEVLHVLPQQFILDGQTEIKDPIGMSGVRLEVEVHIVTGAVASAANVTKSCQRAGIVVEDIFLEQLAASEAVLSDDEREIGVCLIDGGGGTTDMAAFNRGAVYHTAVLQIGGNNFTHDLTVGLSTSEKEAEKLKMRHGCVWMDMVSPDDVVEVASVGGRPGRKIARPVLTQILQARAEEVFTIFAGEFQKKNLAYMFSAGVVLSGGMANLEGVEELATDVLGVPVRIGRPSNIGGLSDMVQDPIYATSVGLALLHAKKGKSSNAIVTSTGTSGSEEKMFGDIWSRMRAWLAEFF
ncbi:MAG: cell division protein FtsA [Deferribacteraceae bacterium]|jgi:cell division protein FtsA|nr:cell division protein FtsA [Deferribacteraceae bacterium]